VEDRVVFDDRSGYRYASRPASVDRDRAVSRGDDRDLDPRGDDRRADSRRAGERQAAEGRRGGQPDERNEFERGGGGTDRDAQVLGDVSTRRGQRPQGGKGYESVVVFLNGRSVRFLDTRPHDLNGTLFVPLAPIAEAANLRYEHRAGDLSFAVFTPEGRAEGRAGVTRVAMGGRDSIDLGMAPISLDGEIYVSPEYLSRVAGLRTRWDRPNFRLDLESERETR